MYKKLPYDPVKDFVPLALVAKIPFVLVVNPSLPVRLGRGAGQVRQGQSRQAGVCDRAGPARPHHLYAELFKSMTGIEMTHVPYKGSAPALTDVVAGHVPLLFSDPAPSLPLIREGKVRALGVTDRRPRSPSAPEIPPIAEAGVPGFDAAGWGMIAAPAGTPKPIVDQAPCRAQQRRWHCPTFSSTIIRLGMIPGGSPSPEELAALHHLRDRALGQGRAAGRACGIGIIAGKHAAFPTLHGEVIDTP